MSDIELHQSGAGGLLTRDARRGSRALSHDGVRGLLRRNRINIETEVTIEKTESVTSVTGTQLSCVARVAQAQTSLEVMTPQASARFNMVADDHALSMMDMGADHRRALRRI